jgi:hypothetical protein
MENLDSSAMDAEMNALNEKFNEKVIESYWSENGELIYVMQDGTNLKEYAKIAETILKDNWSSETDFICKLMYSDGQNPVSFECNFSMKDVGDDIEEIEPMTALDELEDFKNLWPDYFLEKIKSEGDIEYPIGYGVDLLEMKKLILDYINESKEIDIPITIVLINLAREREIISVPANI